MSDMIIVRSKLIGGKYMTNILKNKKGVTLIELLAVIIILGIIAAIAIPTIGNLIERQEARAAEATFSSIEESVRIFSLDATDGTYNLEQLGMNFGSNTVSLTESGSHEPANIDFIVASGVATFDDDKIFINGFEIDTETGLVVTP